MCHLPALRVQRADGTCQNWIWRHQFVKNGSYFHVNNIMNGRKMAWVGKVGSYKFKKLLAEWILLHLIHLGNQVDKNCTWCLYIGVDGHLTINTPECSIESQDAVWLVSIPKVCMATCHRIPECCFIASMHGHVWSSMSYCGYFGHCIGHYILSL